MYSSFVEQVTTTIGTGPYTVSGTLAGRRTFAQGYTGDQSFVPYVVTDDAGNFECGIGSWTVATNTLARTTVLESSNANAAVNWAAGSKRIYVAPHGSLALPLSVRHVIVNGTAPGVGDDLNYGFGPMSQSMDVTNEQLYVCFSGSAGAAAWRRVLIPSAAGTAHIPGDIRDDRTNARYGTSGMCFNAGKTTPSGHSTFSDGAITGLTAQTSDATPVKMGGGANWDGATYYGVYCEAKSATRIKGSVVALDNATGDIRSWDVSATLKTDAAGVVTIASNSVTLDYSGDASLSALALVWDAPTGGGGWEVTLQATGIAATNITWTAALTLAQSVYI